MPGRYSLYIWNNEVASVQHRRKLQTSSNFTPKTSSATTRRERKTTLLKIPLPMTCKMRGKASSLSNGTAGFNKKLLCTTKE
jgi:hypothetical protein